MSKEEIPGLQLTKDPEAQAKFQRNFQKWVNHDELREVAAQYLSPSDCEYLFTATPEDIQNQLQLLEKYEKATDSHK